MIGFNLGQLPFTYLGVPIFRGRPKSIHFQHIADRVKLKLAAWKASLLSIAGRIQLVKSVVHGMLIHSFSVYSWPVSLIRDIERCIKNFIVSGDITKRKLVTISWKKICKSYEEGGLGLRSLITINEAYNLKNCWNLFNSKESWAIILRDRALRQNSCIHHHIYSSLWYGMKNDYNGIIENSTFMIGNGEKDKWCGDSLCISLHIPQHLHSLLSAKVSDFINNFQWNIPWFLELSFPNLRSLIQQVIIPADNRMDKIIWNHSPSGDLNLKDAYTFKSNHSPVSHWAQSIWHRNIPPSKSLVAWRLMHDKMPTNENLIRRGCCLPSICNLCLNNQETSFHIFFDCPYAIKIWTWLSTTININLHFNNITEIWQVCDRRWTPQCKIVIKAAIVNFIATIWFVRNQARFNNNIIQWKSTIAYIISSVTISGNNTSCTSYSSMCLTLLSLRSSR